MTMESQEDLLTGTERHPFGADACFLCGVRLGPTNATEEHVIPRWAQGRYELWNQRLTLLNGTTLPYRALTVPCCSPCNSRHLKPLEDKLSAAVASGASAVRNLDPRTIFLWLGKVFWGLLYRELFLAFDRKERAAGTITSPDLMREYRMHHYFLQSARVPLTFSGFLPGSVFVYDVKPTAAPNAQWFLSDDIETLFICCTMGEVGLVGALQDGGAQWHQFRDVHDRLKGHPLHPLQFREVAAKHCYASKLFDRIPKYMITDDGVVRQAPLQGLSAKPIFRPWSQQEYASVLSQFSLQSLDRIFSPPDLVMTWLWEAGSTRLKHLSFDDCPWPT